MAFTNYTDKVCALAGVKNVGMPIIVHDHNIHREGTDLEDQMAQLYLKIEINAQSGKRNCHRDY